MYLLLVLRLFLPQLLLIPAKSLTWQLHCNKVKIILSLWIFFQYYSLAHSITLLLKALFNVSLSECLMWSHGYLLTDHSLWKDF
jgi:hypothetical protein